MVGFGAGEPDFPTPAAIVEAAIVACRDEGMHHLHAHARPATPEAIAAKTARDSGYEVSAQQVLVTNGSKHSVYNAFQTLLDPGDEVLLRRPTGPPIPRR